ncbi:DNA mismatch repair endonuclease MutL [Desulfospira joergensenii]|uniref:DNA mismatch repair endonuclease MutL n=1 Tax=Desulfospira joergensenii TaxID=53329 RepID=UPI0003B3687A|nr:DNA mismatch repair endonuclease MutL [Desulfospira joergensenii]
MAEIRILPDILSNQIAAGEVVARPASVVKELVENSIDAGAQRISVEIENGGKRLIRISDDGAGLTRDQALLSIERYATSKIFTREDLFSIATFGFRGEALPSIASVSRFCLVTRTRDSDIGTRIDISGGRLSDVSDTGAPPGTMVEVKNLFFNTPARRKFLKSQATETGHIADTLSGMALGNPGIGFRLIINQKQLKNFLPGQNKLERSRAVLGKDAADRLFRLEAQENDIFVTGTCTHPSVTRSASSRIFLFVNNRLVYDRGLIAAVFQGYRGRIMKGRFPMGTVYVRLPFDQVDVNVHPSKREIKFLHPGPVYRLVTRAVEKALAQAQENVIQYAGQGRADFTDEAAQPPGENGPRIPFDSGPDPRSAENKPFAWHGAGLPEKVEQAPIQWGARESYREPLEACPPDPPLPREPEKREGDPEDRIRILGQVMNTYILAEKHGSLIMVDQHAAHERIVYEQLKRRHQSLSVQSQTLLAPETLELGHREADLLSGVLDDLSGLGLKIEPFGPATFAVRAVPALIAEKDIQSLVLEIVDSLVNKKDSVSGWLEECLISMACHTAVRANKEMNPREMESLLQELFTCDNPMHCPHGRPTLVSFDPARMEKMFKRQV